MKSLPRLFVGCALLMLTALSARANGIELGVTVTGTAANRSAKFIITNTGNVDTVFSISRNTVSRVIGRPDPIFNGKKPLIEITYKLNGASFNGKEPGQAVLSPGQTASVDMSVRFLDKRKALVFGRILTTTVRATSLEITQTARVPKINLPPVTAEASTKITLRGSR